MENIPYRIYSIRKSDIITDSRYTKDVFYGEYTLDDKQYILFKESVLKNRENVP